MKVTALTPIKFGGKLRPEGDSFEVDEETGASLIASGSAEKGGRKKAEPTANTVTTPTTGTPEG